MLVTDSTALPSFTSVTTSTRPSTTLWRTALVSRLATSRSTSKGSPSRGAGVVTSSMWIPSRSISGWRSTRASPTTGGEVDGFASIEPALAAGEGEEGFDQARLLVVRGEHLLGGGTPCGDRRVGVVERNLQQGALGGKGGAQFVGGVGDEVTLRLERSVEPPEQVIEGVPEFLQLVLRAVEGQALVQVGRGDPSGRAGDGPDGSQHPAGNEPAGEEGEHGHDGQRDSRVDEKLVRVGGALCGFGGPYLCQLMHGLCQLIAGLRQLVLVLCQLIPGLCQLMLVLCQLMLDLCQPRPHSRKPD